MVCSQEVYGTHCVQSETHRIVAPQSFLKGRESTAEIFLKKNVKFINPSFLSFPSYLLICIYVFIYILFYIFMHVKVLYSANISLLLFLLVLLKHFKHF